ncbi:MAG: methyl-accepting chemotaxis protein [Bacteroidota bacterium]
MEHAAQSHTPSPTVPSAKALFREFRRDSYVHMDRLMGGLLLLQWVGAVVLAFTVSPKTWIGGDSATHLHVYAALFFGGALSLIPAALAFKRPGQASTRYAIAVAQGLYSALLIHLSGGRVETHFHIFASLGILAGYRDWRPVLVTAGVVAVDHVLRGTLYPLSIFGTPTADYVRIGEHAFWVVFMCLFLIRGATGASRQLRRLAENEAAMLAERFENERLMEQAQGNAELLTLSQQQQEAAFEALEQDRNEIRHRVQQALDAMEAFGRGQTDVRLPDDLDGSTGELFRGFNHLAGSMGTMLEQMHTVANQTAQATAHISTSAAHLSAGAQEQSLQSQEVAAAVEEMTSTLAQTALHVAQTAELVEQNGAKAKHGSQIVDQTVDKIQHIARVIETSGEQVGRLGASSDEIGAIVAVISGIADQTNLLALNAAIEAARAGDQGRGFAVVADEVRSLAERTTAATKQISGMIASIQQDTKEAVASMVEGNQQMNEGRALAQQAHEALEDIVNGVNESVHLINQIAAAADEQSSTSTEIAKSVGSMSAIATESAHGISEISSAVDTLAQDAMLLRDQATQFTTA